MSGGIRSCVPRRPGLDAVRRSAVRALRRALVVRVAVERTISRRSSSTSAPGLRAYGEQLGGKREFHGTVLLTHLHWDHVQGLPFFAPLHDEASTLDVYGPRQAEGAARRRVRADDVAAVLPDPTRRSGGRGALPRHRRRRLPDRPRQGAVALGASRRPDARASASTGTARRSRTSPTTARVAAPTTPTTSCRTRSSSCATASTC